MNKFATASLLALLALSAVLAEESNETSFENETIVLELELNDSSNETSFENETLSNNTIFENQTLLDDETRDEVSSAITTPYGLTVRLLQLARQIDSKISNGNDVISTITGYNSTADTTALSAILAELGLVKDEALAMADQAFGDVSSATLAYVDLRHEATDLVSEFRTLARDALSGYNVENLRTRLRESNETILRERIRNMINIHNANRLMGVLGNMGLENEDLVNQAMNGSINATGIMQRLRDYYDSMNVTAKRNSLNRIFENNTRLNVRELSILENAIENASARIQNRLEDRLTRIRDRTEEIVNGLEERINERLNDDGNNGNGNGRGGHDE